MIAASKNDVIDFDLVDQIIEHIPEQTWPIVIKTIVANIVDNMPSEVVLKLTNTPDDFDKAEEIVLSYYKDEERKQDLIVDAFKLLGVENTVYLLDSLQLDKQNEFIDSAPCSIEPQ